LPSSLPPLFPTPSFSLGPATAISMRQNASKPRGGGRGVLSVSARARRGGCGAERRGGRGGAHPCPCRRIGIGTGRRRPGVRMLVVRAPMCGQGRVPAREHRVRVVRRQAVRDVESSAGVEL
jgi:hypothetical protein